MSEATSVETIDGRTVTLSVSLATGLWTAVHDHESIAQGATRDSVIKKARAALRRKKVRLSIPGTLVEVRGDAKPLHVLITGLHTQNGDVLYQAVDGTDKGRLSGYSWRRSAELCARLTDAELTAFVTLRKAASIATAAFKKWQQRHVIPDGEEFVKEAIEAQVEAADAD